MSTIGLGQVRGDYVEPALVTAGKDLNLIKHYVSHDKLSYSAAEVVKHIVAGNSTVPGSCDQLLFGK